MNIDGPESGTTRRAVAAAGAGVGERTAAGADGAIARARSAAYALFSQLTGSPARGAGAEDLLPPSDLGEVAALLAEGLPYELDLSALIEAAERLGAGAAARLARDYGGLFEVGSEGALVPLREELASARPSRAKEEVVRYYQYFGYELLEECRWAPDHLAIELEFLHFLAFREAASLSAGPDGADWLSYRLAQLDFLERHPLDWIGEVVAGVVERAGEPYHRLLFESLARFLERDHRWLTDMSEGT